MFGIGSTELAIILVFGFLLFGPDKLPQMGHTIGRALRQFRETQEKMTSVVQAEVIDPMTAAASAPLKPRAAAAPEDDDSDADLPADAPAAPHQKETFAERRARLAAEKAAREAEAAEAAGTAGDSAATAEPAATAESAPETAPAEPEPAEEPEVRTTADLYARRPRRRAAEAPEPAEGPETDAPAAEGGER